MSHPSHSPPPLLPPNLPLLPAKPAFQPTWSQYCQPTVAEFSPPILPITPKRQGNQPVIIQSAVHQANIAATMSASPPEIISMPPPLLDADRVLVTEHGWRPIRAGETPTPHAALAASQIGLWDRQPQPNFNHQWGYFGFEPGSNQHSGNTSTHDIMTVAPPVQTATIQPFAGVVGSGGWRGYLALTTCGGDQPSAPGCLSGMSDARWPGVISSLSGQGQGQDQAGAHFNHHPAPHQTIPQQQQIGVNFNGHPSGQMTSQSNANFPSTPPQNVRWKIHTSPSAHNQVVTPRISGQDNNNDAQTQETTPPPELPDWTAVPSDPSTDAPATTHCNLPLAPPPSPPQIVTAAPPAFPSFPSALAREAKAAPPPPREEGKKKDPPPTPTPAAETRARARARLLAEQRAALGDDVGCCVEAAAERRAGPISSLLTGNGSSYARGRYRRGGFGGRAEWIRALAMEANRNANRDGEGAQAGAATVAGSGSGVVAETVAEAAAGTVAGAAAAAPAGKKKKKGNRGGGRGGRGASRGMDAAAGAAS